MPKIRISFPLITHVACTNNKTAKNKYWKINNQRIYDGSINKFKRAIIVENMHNYVINCIDDSILNLKINKIKNLEYIFNTVINHGSISRRGDKIFWKKPDKNYEPNWDLNNISDIWIKTGNDALTIAGVTTDDNAGVIKTTTYSMNEVDHIDDLELEIIITY
jgi:hypothetical protein